MAGKRFEVDAVHIGAPACGAAVLRLHAVGGGAAIIDFDGLPADECECRLAAEDYEN